MKKPELFRRLRIARLRRKIEQRSFPRLFMLLLVILTAGVGFLSSVLMLHGGLHNMGVRYAAACGLAYLVFFVMLWIWLKLLRWGGDDAGGDALRSDSAVDLPLSVIVPGSGGSGTSSSPILHGGGGTFDGGGASANVDFDPGLSSFGSADGVRLAGVGDLLPDDVDEVAAPLVALVLVVALLAACGALLYAAFNLVGTAPVLFSELIFDGILAAGLYRRFRYKSTRHWAETALQGTIRPFFAVLLLVGALGFFLSWQWPQAYSIGAVIRILRA